MNQLVSLLTEMKKVATSAAESAKLGGNYEKADFHNGEVSAFDRVIRLIEEQTILTGDELVSAFDTFRAYKKQQSGLMTFSDVFNKPTPAEELENYLKKYFGADKDV